MNLLDVILPVILGGAILMLVTRVAGKSGFG